MNYKITTNLFRNISLRHLFSTTLLTLFISVAAFAQMRGPLEEPYIPGHLIVQIDADADIKRIVKSLPSEYEFTVNRLLAQSMRAWLIEFNPDKLDQMAALNLVGRQNGISIVQNNHIVEVRSVPNDPSYGQQWHHKNTGQTGGTPGADINSEGAWEITTGGKNAKGDDIVVCILEAVDFSHNDLRDNHWVNTAEIPGNGIDDDGNGYIDDIHGWDLQSNSGNLPTFNSGHGTQVAGMIGATGNNSLGVAGINWDVKMMNVTGYNTNSEASVVSAYEYPLAQRKIYNESNGQRGAFVVSTNASWGIDRANPANYPIWCAFYDTLGRHGILNVGSTSNQNVNVDVQGDMPTGCGSQYMVGVGRSDHNDNFQGGYGATTVNFAAPGVNVLTTSGGNNYGTTTGTSFSGPLTAGTIALMYSIPCPNLMTIALANPQEAADYVFHALMNGNDPRPAMDGFFVTNGRLNAKNAIDLLMEEVCSPCSAPSIIEVSEIEDHSAKITFSGNELADNYTVYYREQGLSSWNSTTITDTTLTLTGLNNCATYEFYIELLCDTEISSPSATTTFKTTNCGNCIDLEYCATNVTNPGLQVSVFEPSSLSTTYDEYAQTAGWGGDIGDGYVYGEYVLVDDGSAIPEEGCDALLNGADLDGKIAVALRGTCMFSIKAFNAQNAGAKALIIINNAPQMLNQLGAGDNSDDVEIPVIMIPQAEGTVLLDALKNGEQPLGIMGVQNEWIEAFTFNGTSVTSGDDNGYKAPSNNAFEVVLNQSYDFTIEPGFAGTPTQQYSRIWIDYNQNGTFEANELVYDQENASTTSVNGSITIPNDALLGSTRMRVQMNYQGVAASDLSEVCEDYQSGEIEDYCIEIRSGDQCNFTVVTDVEDPACSSVKNGSISLTVGGGEAPYTYVWSNNAGNVSSVSNLNAGNYNVKITDANGCDTTVHFQLDFTTQLVIDEVAVNQPSCDQNDDGSITVVAHGGDNITYQWINGPAAETISDLGAGSYTVVATAENGCQRSRSFMLSYTTNVSVTADITNPKCNDTNDGSITAVGIGGQGISYSWTDGPETATWNGIGVGVYEVTATAENGCSATNTFELEANPTPPTVGFTTVVDYMNVSVLNTSSNANGYLWDFGDGTTATAFNTNHTYEEEGTYTICLTAIGECEDKTTCQEVTVEKEDVTSVLENAKEIGILVYPNPASSTLNFVVDNNSVETVLFFDAAGKLIFTEELSQGTTTLSIEQLQTGLYFYHIKNADQTTVHIGKVTITK